MSVVTDVSAFAWNMFSGRRNAPITSAFSTISRRTASDSLSMVPWLVMNATTPFGLVCERAWTK